MFGKTKKINKLEMKLMVTEINLSRIKEDYKELKKNVDENNHKILGLEREYWKLKNPPKYKVGDRISKNEVIINVFYIYRHENLQTKITIKQYWEYKCLNLLSKEIKSILK